MELWNNYCNPKRIFRQINLRIKRRIRSGGEEKINWGVIGTGYMSNVFTSALNGSSSSQVISVSSRSLERSRKFAKRNRIPNFYESYENMIEDESIKVDIFYVATPLETHFEIVKYLLERGKNVLCEKPIVRSSEQLVLLKKIADKNGCFLMESMWSVCLPTFVKSKQWIDDGLIGDLDLIRVDFNKKEIDKIGKPNLPENDVCAVLYDFGIYTIAFYVWLIKKKPSQILSFTRLGNESKCSDFMVNLRSDSVQTFINISSNFNSNSKAIVMGSNGSIEWESQFNRTHTVTLFNKHGEVIEIFKSKYSFEGFEYIISEVNNCLVRGSKESDIVPIISSLLALEITEEIVNRGVKWNGID